MKKTVKNKITLPISLNNKLFTQSRASNKEIYIVEVLKSAILNKKIVKEAQKRAESVYLKKKKKSLKKGRRKKR